MASTNISYHLHNDTDEVRTNVKVKKEGALSWVEFNLIEDGNLISSFTIFDEDGRNLAKLLVNAGNELANIYRAREQEEYDRLREEEEWDWAARTAELGPDGLVQDYVPPVVGNGPDGNPVEAA